MSPTTCSTLNMSDDDDNALLSIDTTQLDLVSMPSSLADLAKMDRDLKQAAMDIPAPETQATPEPTSTTKKWFRTATDDDIQHFYYANQSANTKRVKSWGMNIFQGIFHTTNIEWIHSKYYWYWMHI